MPSHFASISVCYYGSITHMIPSSSTKSESSLRPLPGHEVPPRKKLRPTTTDDILNQLALDALDILSRHPLAPTSASPRSSSQLLVDAPESPHSFFKRVGISTSSTPQSQTRSPMSHLCSGPDPPPLPRPRPTDYAHQLSLRASPSAQPARRRLNPSNSLSTPRLLLTPTTARAAQSLLDLTQ